MFYQKQRKISCCVGGKGVLEISDLKVLPWALRKN